MIQYDLSTEGRNKKTVGGFCATAVNHGVVLGRKLLLRRGLKPSIESVGPTIPKKIAAKLCAIAKCDIICVHHMFKVEDALSAFTSPKPSECGAKAGLNPSSLKKHELRPPGIFTYPHGQARSVFSLERR